MDAEEGQVVAGRQAVEVEGVEVPLGCDAGKKSPSLVNLKEMAQNSLMTSL